MLIGAIANSLPDIDILNGLWMNTAQELWHHRGITHSLLFAVVSTVLLSYFANKIYKNKMPQAKWVLLIGLNVFVHIFIDTFNAYGTAWFLPFNSTRISFNTLFVADPLFSIGPFIAFIMLLVLSKKNITRNKWVKTGIASSCIYLVLALISKLVTEKEVKESFAEENIAPQKFFTTPSPFNTLLWYVVAKDTAGYYVGYRSVFDSRPTSFNYFAQHDYLLQSSANRQDIQYLKKFADDFYTVENRNDTLLFNVLRFGQIVGWHDANEKFMLHYYVNYPRDNDLVVQRGRFQRWNKETLQSFFTRMFGN